MRDKLLSGYVKTKSAVGSARRKNAFLGLFDLPVFKDWIVWLASAAIIVGIGNVVGDYQRPVMLGGLPMYGSTEFSIEGQEVAFLFDCVFAGGIQFLLFGLLPASIRRRYRQGKAGS